MNYGYYNGCVKSNNFGDDILFPLFLLLLKNYFSNKFKKTIQVINKKIEYDEKWKSKTSIDIIGGGSLIHAEELSYTNGWDNKPPEYLFGTGLTDAPSCSFALDDLEKLNNGFIDDVKFPLNKMMEKNFEIISKISYGGLRSALDNRFSNNIKPSIYDAGLLFYSLFPEKQVHLPNNRFIVINLTTVSSKNIFAPFFSSTIETNDLVYNEMSKFISYLIRDGISIVFMPCSLGENHIYKQIINQLEPSLQKHTKIFETLPSNEEVAYLYKNALLSIGTRLHSNIISASCATPFISLSYGYKCIGFCYSVDMLDFSIPYYKVNTQILQEKIHNIEKDQIKIKAKLKLHSQQAKHLHEAELARYLNTKNIDTFDIIQWSDEFHPTFGVFELKKG